MKKLLFSLSLIIGAAQLLHAQCEPTTTLNEDFESFTSFPENCWTTSTGYPYFFLDTTIGNQSAVFHSMTIDDYHYLVTPPLSTINGHYRLSFKGKRDGLPGNIKVQVGTLSDNTDYSTFVAHGDEMEISSTTETEYTSIVIPATSGHEYVALKVIGTSAHQVLYIDDVTWSDVGGDCVALSSFDENFDGFTDFPENCWGTSSPYPFFMFDDETEDKTVTFYAMSAADYHYIVTPELSTINGEYLLKFKASRGGVPGPIAVQIGTLSDNTDFSTFVANGSEIEVTATDETEYSSIAIPGTAEQKYVAIRIKATAEHQSLTFHNIAWEAASTTGIENNNSNNVSIYPNPAEDKLFLKSNFTVERLSIFNITGQKVIELLPLAKETVIDLQDLPLGVYYMQLLGNDQQTSVHFQKK